jgi:hypothetical protein
MAYALSVIPAPLRQNKLQQESIFDWQEVCPITSPGNEYLLMTNSE